MFTKKLRSLDTFGFQPQLSYSGDDMYRTLLGAMFSIACYIAVAGYTGFLVSSMSAYDGS